MQPRIIETRARTLKAWPFYRTISGVRLCWELEEPKGPKGVVAHVQTVAGEEHEVCPLLQRGTSLIRTPPTPKDPHKTLGIGLQQGPRGVRFLMGEVPLCVGHFKRAPQLTAARLLHIATASGGRRLARLSPKLESSPNARPAL